MYQLEIGGNQKIFSSWRWKFGTRSVRILSWILRREILNKIITMLVIISGLGVTQLSVIHWIQWHWYFNQYWVLYVTELCSLIYFLPYVMVESRDKGLNLNYPIMDATSCAFMSLEMLWFNGAAILCWWIPNPTMLTWRELIWRRYYYNSYIPKMAWVKYSFRGRSSGSKLLAGWSITVW